MLKKKIDSSNISYNLYQDVAEDLCYPIDNNLTTEVRYELYLSKLVYLNNLYEQSFYSLNSNQENIIDNQNNLIYIKKSIEFTNAFIRDTILEDLNNSFKKLKLTLQQAKGIQ